MNMIKVKKITNVKNDNNDRECDNELKIVFPTFEVG